MTASAPVARIAELNLYPVKSCRGLAVDAVAFRPTGLVHDGVGDREWMVTDTDGRFLTQREHPVLARVAVTVKAGSLVLAAPGRPPLAVDVASTDPRPVVVWRSEVRACDAGVAAAAWFSALLGRAARLVRFDPADRRPCNPEFAGDSGAHTLFADGYPVLVIGSASLRDLNARLVAGGTAAVPMNRFRPNVVVEGLDPYDEDHLDTIETAGVTLRLVKPCTRCTITTTDQATAATGLEPLATLASYRRDDRLDGATFGMNAVVLRPGPMRVSEEARGTYRF